MAVQDQAFIRRQRARPRDAMTTPKGLALEGVRGLVRRARYAAAPAAVPFGDAPPAIPPLAVADSCAARPRPPMAK